MIPPAVLSILLNRYTIGLAIVIGLVTGAYVKGYSTASSRCHDAELHAQVASLQRDIDAAKAADRAAKALQSDIERQNQELQQKVSDYESELAKRPDTRCALSPDDARRMRGIGGK